eukprot:s3207_g2.t2
MRLSTAAMLLETGCVYVQGPKGSAGSKTVFPPGAVISDLRRNVAAIAGAADPKGGRSQRRCLDRPFLMAKTRGRDCFLPDLMAVTSRRNSAKFIASSRSMAIRFSW